MIENYKRFTDAQLLIVNDNNIHEIISSPKEKHWLNIRIHELEVIKLATPIINPFLVEVDVGIRGE